MPIVQMFDGGGNHIVVLADVFDAFAVHQTLLGVSVRYDARFMVSHVGTGRLVVGWLTYPEAKRVADELMAADVDWHFTDKADLTPQHRAVWERVKATCVPKYPEDDELLYPVEPITHDAVSF